MKAGRELDNLIDEKVMGGIKIFVDEDGCRFEIRGYYSTRIDAAFEVAKKLREDGWFIAVAEGHSFTRAVFERDNPNHWNPEVQWVGFDASKTVDGTNIPHAICLAALKAVGHEG